MEDMLWPRRAICKPGGGTSRRWDHGLLSYRDDLQRPDEGRKGPLDRKGRHGALRCPESPADSGECRAPAVQYLATSAIPRPAGRRSDGRGDESKEKELLRDAQLAANLRRYEASIAAGDA